MMRLDNGHAISAVPSNSVDEAWGHTCQLIEDAIEHAWGVGPADVFKRLQEGSAVLWIVEKDLKIVGIVVTEIVNYPRGRSLNIWLTAGKNLHEWKDCFASLECFARHHGCDYVETTCRPGMKHVLRDLGLKVSKLMAVKHLDRRTH